MSDFREDGRAAVDWVARYLEGVRDLPVLAQVEPGDIRSQLPASPPDEAEPFAAVLRDLDEILLPGITHWNHPRFFAYFAISGSEPGILAELLIAALNVNGMLWRTSPAATELEELATDWVRQLMGLAEGWHGHIEDSASTSTLAALTAARELRPGGTVVCSEHAHSSVDKAARLLGLPLRKVAADEEFRLRPDALAEVVGEDTAAVVATVGTTSTTAVDPVPAVAELAEQAGAWLHVDAAYAGSAMVCEELRWAFDGVERADSLVVNPHKWLLTPVDCSLLFTRRPEDFRAAFSLVPAYLRTDEEATNLMDYGPALGRRFRALKLWAVIRCFGREGLRRRHPRAPAVGAALRRVGRSRAGLGDRGAGAVLGRVLPPRGLGRGEPGAHRARQRDGRGLPLTDGARRPSRDPTRDREHADDRGRRQPRVAGAARSGPRAGGVVVPERLVVTTTDYHTAGEPFRIVTGGVPPLEGATILEKRRWAAANLDHVRRLLVNEPRGHADMYGCFVVEPDDAGADLGVVFFHNAGYSTACGHGTIALARWAADTGRAKAGKLLVDVPSGRLPVVVGPDR